MSLPRVRLLQTTFYNAENSIFLQNKVDHVIFLFNICQYLPIAYCPLFYSPFLNELHIPVKHFRDLLKSDDEWLHCTLWILTQYSLCTCSLEFLEYSALALIPYLDFILLVTRTDNSVLDILTWLRCWPLSCIWLPVFQLASCTTKLHSFIFSFIHPSIHSLKKIVSSTILNVKERMRNVIPCPKLNCLHCSWG